MPDLPPLNARQAAFVREYLLSGNAFDAAEAAGIDMMERPPAKGFYVYIVINPETGAIIYIGKGKHRRMFAHVPAARRNRGQVTNAKKIKALRELMQSGVTPQPLAIFQAQAEREALTIEKSLIGGIGMDNLTNFARGMTSPAERGLFRAQRLLESIKPKNEWIKTNPKMWAGSLPASEFYDRYMDAIKRLIDDHQEVIAGRGIMVGTTPIRTTPFPSMKNNREFQNA